MTVRWRAKAFAAAHPWVVDAVWAVCLAAVSTLLLVNAYANITEAGYADVYATPWQSAVASVLAFAPLVARRRWPVTVLALVSCAHVLYLVWLVPEGVMVAVGYLLAMYTTGDLAADRWRVPARASSLVVVGLAYLWVYTVGLEATGLTGLGLEFGSLGWVTSVVVVAVFMVVAWLLGDAAHERRVRESLLRQRAAELEAEREENARRAVLEERVRIARELHDVVAHSVSVMGIQAAAARTVFARDPAAASRELESIEQTSRSAVAELRRLLGFLRAPDLPAAAGASGDGGRGPQPGADRVGELVSQTSAAGVRTDLTVTGEPRELPAAVSLSVYRIVQEALTNTLKHGRARKAEVLLTYADGAVEVEVLDDGRGPLPRPPDQPPGHGLIGMRERAALHDGQLETGARAGGGFKVWARLPTGGDHHPARTEPAPARP